MKLTPADVAAIRARRAAGEKQEALAFEFDVSQSTISRRLRLVTAPERLGRPRSNRTHETAALALLRNKPEGMHLHALAQEIYRAVTASTRNRTSVLLHGLKCRGSVRRVGVGVWTLTEVA